MLGEAGCHLVQFEADDLLDVILVERTEDDGGIQAVDELGTEGALERIVQFLAHLLVGEFLLGGFIAFGLEAQTGLFLDQVRADVGGHDDDGVAEIHLATLGVGKMTLLHDLQEHVVDLGMGFLHLVEDDDGVGAAAQGFGELTGIIVTDVTGRGTDETRGSVPFHELGHVQLDGGILAAEHELGEGTRQLGLADTGGSEEHERADRALGVLETGAGAADRAGDRHDGVLLPDDGLA